MKKLSVILISFVLFLSLPVQATLIELNPSATTVELGQSFTVDVDVSDLDTASGEVLALYEVLVNFNNSFFALTNIAFGTGLDGGNFGDSDQLLTPEPIDPMAANTIFENSFLSLAELQALQANPFTLLTFTFDAIGLTAGSDLTLDILPFGFLDFDGLDIAVNANTQGAILPATIEVIERTAVPEPASILLWLLAGLGLFKFSNLRM